MTVLQFQNQNTDKREEIYDLENEKKVVVEVTEEVKKELLEKWQKEYLNSQIFPDKVKKISIAVIDFLLFF